MQQRNDIFSPFQQVWHFWEYMFQEFYFNQREYGTTYIEGDTFLLSTKLLEKFN